MHRLCVPGAWGVGILPGTGTWRSREARRLSILLSEEKAPARFRKQHSDRERQIAYDNTYM